MKILNNQVLNIDGRKSDGAGGWLTYNDGTPIKDGSTKYDYNIACFV